MGGDGDAALVGDAGKNLRKPSGREVRRRLGVGDTEFAQVPSEALRLTVERIDTDNVDALTRGELEAREDSYARVLSGSLEVRYRAHIVVVGNRQNRDA